MKGINSIKNIYGWQIAAPYIVLEVNTNIYVCLFVCVYVCVWRINNSERMKELSWMKDDDHRVSSMPQNHDRIFHEQNVVNDVSEDWNIGGGDCGGYDRQSSKSDYVTKSGNYTSLKDHLRALVPFARTTNDEPNVVVVQDRQLWSKSKAMDMNIEYADVNVRTHL